MNSADAQVIAMANRPRERMERMEQMARQAQGRRMQRRAEKQAAKDHRARVIDRAVHAIAAAGVVLLFTAMFLILVVV